MEIRSFGSLATITCVAAIMLAGCGSPEVELKGPSGSVSPAIPIAQTLRTQSPATGGAFGGGYSGTYHLFQECFPGGPGGQLKFTGGSKVSFLGRGFESGSTSSSSFCDDWAGTATLTSSAHPKD
jgi:hypothetical protein